jgi:hypothetical protein
MSRQALVLGSTLVLAGCAAALGCHRSPADDKRPADHSRPADHRKPMENALAPTSDDLEQAYRARDPNLAGHQSAEAVVVGADGITVLCSANPRGDGEHTWLIRLGDTGSVGWQRHYPTGQGVGRALAALPGGGFAIAGELQRSAMEYQGYLLRTDASGNVTAGAAFGPRGVTGFSALVALADGSTLAGGSTGNHGWLVQADPALHATWDAPLADLDDVAGVTALPDGGFAVAARRERSTTGFGLTRVTAFAADHQVRWQAQLPASGRGEPAAVSHLADGSVVVVGHHTAGDRDRAQVWVARLTGADPIPWQRLLGSPEEERRGRAIAALPDGGVAIAGEVLRDGHRGLRVARLAADGSVTWERSFGGTGQDTARGIAATADGGLVVVGSTTTQGAGKTNVWILRLDGDGKLRWDRVFGTAG